MSQSTRIVRPTRMTGAIAAAVTAAWPPVPQVSGDAAYCLNSLVSSPMPSIATVTVLTGSFMTPTPTNVPAGDQIAGQQRHVRIDRVFERSGHRFTWGKRVETGDQRSFWFIGTEYR